MCLAVPGRIVAITAQALADLTREAPDAGHRRHPVEAEDRGLPTESAAPPAPELPADPDLWRMATVDFGGVRQPVSLACLPEARLGDRVLVHVGLAICRVEESESELTVEPMAEAESTQADPMEPGLTEPDPTEAATLGTTTAPAHTRSRPPAVAAADDRLLQGRREGTAAMGLHARAPDSVPEPLLVPKRVPLRGVRKEGTP